MKHRLSFLSLTVLLSASVFLITACANPDSPAQSMIEKGGVNELIKIDDKIGTGTEATAGHNVSVHYTGWLYDETAPRHKGNKFDSSFDHGDRPFTFLLGGGVVIQGWDQGVVGMKVGGKRTLIIPAALGYGASGDASGKIPPEAPLVFEVQLFEVR